ncbi:hypothetical protein DITRI_Ditri07aG0150400 [Diplodiscus trichospermus]
MGRCLEIGIRHQFMARKAMHSHNYRLSEPFRDQVVILIGSSASAVDICRDLASVAKEIDSAHGDGTVVFRNRKVVLADVIMHCTGYKCHFPFLDTNGIVTVDDNRVGPLYKHIFPPALAPCLAFVGIPRKIAPFRLYEIQSKWFEYINWLASQCGCQSIEKWRQQMFCDAYENMRLRPETYRDGWEDHPLLSEAHEDFTNYTSLLNREKNEKCKNKYLYKVQGIQALQ